MKKSCTGRVYCLLRSLYFFVLLTASIPAGAQIPGPVPSPFNSIEQNSVSVMGALGDTLWIGPGLNRNIGNTAGWYLPEQADSIVNGRGRLFSIALAPDTVIAGLGFNFQTSNGSVQTGLGYHISIDGGLNWSYHPPLLDEPSDTEVVYGGETYAILPITVPQQSPPFEVDFEGDVVFSASWASGILRSTDFGASWERLLLPPQDRDSLVPGQTYTFTSGDGENRYDPRFDQNLLGFSVLVNNDGTVWAGTAGGLNISPDALTAPHSQVRWKHIRVNGEAGGLLGNWIIAMERQPSTGDIWMANWNAGLHPEEQFGVVRASDGGENFDRYLVGERINGLAFRGTYVFAAGDNGLFVSPDDGESWQRVDRIQSPNTFIKPSARYLSAASTTGRVWIGTTDGIASTGDLGATWEITRVDFPLRGGNRYQPGAPDVESYAYPNPFSPLRHEVVRIKFEVKSGGEVKVRLFDFGMNLIKELENASFSPGTYEAVWDGNRKTGSRVANGPVFYQIETPGGIVRGKILVLD